MFLAILAFVLQSTLISISQAKAALGAMPEPSVTLSGSVHFHDQLAGHVHSHEDDSFEVMFMMGRITTTMVVWA